MDQNILLVYKPRKSLMASGLAMLVLIFFGLTLPLLVDRVPAEKGKIIGLTVFWLIGIGLTLLPFAFKLEVGNDFVRTSFFGFKVRELHSKDIQVLEYGNILRLGGLGAGRGLKGWEGTKRGGSRYFSLGEAAYGKEAISHAKRVLEQKLKY